MNTRNKRQQQLISELQQQWDLLSAKLAQLEKAKIIEVDPAGRFRLEQMISELKAEREQVEQRLTQLEDQSSNQRDISSNRSPERTELIHRLQDILKVLDKHPEQMKNRDVNEIEDLLHPDKIDRNTWIISLLRQVQDNNPSLTFLDRAEEDIDTIEEIFKNRTGERYADTPQEMDYSRLAEIREYIRATLPQLKETL